MKMQQDANAWKEDKKRQVETFCNKMSIKIRRCKPRGGKTTNFYTCGQLNQL